MMCGMTLSGAYWRSLRGLFTAIGFLVFLAACASQPNHSAPDTTPTTPAVTAPAPLAEHDPQITCNTLANEHLLASAEGFVVVAGVLTPGDVESTAARLDSIAGDAPVLLQAQLESLARSLRALDAVITTGGGVADTNSILATAEFIGQVCAGDGVILQAIS